MRLPRTICATSAPWKAVSTASSTSSGRKPNCEIGITPGFLRQDHRQLVNAIAAHHLRHVRALEGRLDGLEHFQRAEAKLRQTLWTKMHCEHRRARRSFDLDIGVALHGGK